MRAHTTTHKHLNKLKYEAARLSVSISKCVRARGCSKGLHSNDDYSVNNTRARKVHGVDLNYSNDCFGNNDDHIITVRN